MRSTVTVDYAGVIHVSPAVAFSSLYPHQQEAISRMDARIRYSNKTPFSGLLVVPTGGGKTLIAVRWLLQNMVDRKKKVLWIAHRHELLEQAFRAIRDNACSNVLTHRESFRYRIISGQHDKPVNIQRQDDIIIASKDSLNRGLGYLLDNWLSFTDEVFLTIDEAHHATAKTYRKIIDAVKGADSGRRTFRMLGLTATPFRTAESEQGFLGKLFEDDVVYKVDLRQLVNQRILAQPVFEELKTGIDLTRELTDRDIKTIWAFDELPEHVATQIAGSAERNKNIVSHYIENLEKYDQLIVFAVNIVHAIALNALFNQELNKHFETKNRTYAEYVVGAIKDMATGASITENAEKIEKFRKGEIRVLVNVIILTEGIDLPNARTAFLTRPTTSTILMTQMIGRVLRGERAGGTKQAYIVSFVDNWQDKISWISPARVCIETAGEFDDTSGEISKRLVQLIAIAKIEEFALMMDRQILELEALDFLQRVPVGLFSFSVLLPARTEDDALEKNCEVMVFDHLQEAYGDLLENLPYIFQDIRLTDDEYLSNEDLDQLCHTVKDEYFQGYDISLGYHDEDIKDILRYYAQKGVAPTFLGFEEREKCDLAKEARYIYEHSLGGEAKTNHIDLLWNNENSFWQILFGHNKLFFVRQLNIEEEKISYPPPSPSDKKARVEPDEIDVSRLSLSEMKIKAPLHWKKLRDEVFARHTDTQGFITCAISGFKSKYKIHFQIHHKKPVEQGGLSMLDNLQVLERSVHRKLHNTQFIKLEDLENATGKKPSHLRLPDGTVLSVKTWKDVIRESCRFVLAHNPTLPMPYPDRFGKKVSLFSTVKPAKGISYVTEEYNGQTIYIYVNYNTNNCIRNAIYILEQVPQSNSSVPAAVVLRKKE